MPKEILYHRVAYIVFIEKGKKTFTFRHWIEKTSVRFSHGRLNIERQRFHVALRKYVFILYRNAVHSTEQPSETLWEMGQGKISYLWFMIPLYGVCCNNNFQCPRFISSDSISQIIDHTTISLYVTIYGIYCIKSTNELKINYVRLNEFSRFTFFIRSFDLWFFLDLLAFPNMFREL